MDPGREPMISEAQNMASLTQMLLSPPPLGISDPGSISGADRFTYYGISL
jgi:hypothetical protein